MSEYNTFLEDVYSEESYPFTESEYDEVMSLMAQDDEAWEGFADWSQDLEQAQWEREQERAGTVFVDGSPMLLKRDCNHSDCSTTRCERGQSYRGIAV